MLKVTGKVASVTSSDWDFNGKSGTTHRINVIEENGFIRAVKASGATFTRESLPNDGDVVELPVQVFGRAREDGSVQLSYALSPEYEAKPKAVRAAG